MGRAFRVSGTCGMGSLISLTVAPRQQNNLLNASKVSFERDVVVHYETILILTNRATGDDQLAEDITQETFLIAFQHLGQLREMAAVKSWLYRISHNLVLAEWRRRAHYPSRPVDELRDGETVGERLFISDSTSGTEEHDAIDHVLDDLSPVTRDVVLLNCCCGYTASEIADSTNSSLAAVERRLSRAKSHLRRGLSSDAGR